MPSLNLSNPLRRDPNRPTLKQRAAALKASAAGLIRKPKLLPPAGSPQAMEAFGEACRAVDAASRLSNADIEALHIMPGGASLWTSDTVTAALVGNFSRFLPREMEAARETPRARLEDLRILTLRRELRMAEAMKASRMRELFTLAYGDEPDPADEDEAPPSDEKVDWHNPPPSFMAFPAIEPGGFVRIERGLPLEAGRLLGIARDELARRMERPAPGETEADRQRREADHRARLLIPALMAAADPDSAGAEALAALDAAAAADVELIALGRAFDIATVRDREANDVATAAEVRAEARMPERPASLFFRVEDAPFCLREYHSHPEALAGQPVTPRDLGWMTRRPAEREIWVDAPPGSKGSNMVPGKVPQIVPWPEAQARIDEIKAAFKVWDLEKDRILEEEGLWDADEAAGRASDKAADLAQQIAALPARTADGMRVKLRVAAFYGVCDPDTQVDAGYPGEAAIRSLYRDTPGIKITADPAEVRIVPEA